MNLEIQTMWSPDLIPPSEGLPENTQDYDVFMQVSIGEIGQAGGEVFHFRVCAASVLRETESGNFISHTLVLEKFSWFELENRLKKLLLHTSSCKDWKSVIEKLQPYIQHSDA